MSCVSVPGYEPLTMSKDLPHISWIYPQRTLEELKKIPSPPSLKKELEWKMFSLVLVENTEFSSIY